MIVQKFTPEEIAMYNNAMDLFCSFPHELQLSLVKEFFGADCDKKISCSGDREKDWNETKDFLMFIRDKYKN
jgi:hypothetical protein